METSINNQPCGSAAKTPSINSNHNPESENQMLQRYTEVVNPDDTPVSLKTNAALFDCYHGTLKNQVKNKKLPALQEGPKSPYRVKPSDVEKLLRGTPGIASIFHPAESRPPTDAAAEMTQPKPDQAAPASAGKHDPVAESKTDEPATADAHAQMQQLGDIAQPDSNHVNTSAPASDSYQSPHPRKRRRRSRGRGKNGAAQSNPSGMHSLALKALNGSSPEERLRITACLNELTSLIALA